MPSFLPPCPTLVGASAFPITFCASAGISSHSSIKPTAWQPWRDDNYLHGFRCPQASPGLAAPSVKRRGGRSRWTVGVVWWELHLSPARHSCPFPQPQHPTSFWQQPAPQSHPMTHGPTSRALLLLPGNSYFAFKPRNNTLHPGSLPAAPTHPPAKYDRLLAKMAVTTPVVPVCNGTLWLLSLRNWSLFLYLLIWTWPCNLF